MIYCVEDDDNIRELVIYTLETTGLKARGFADGSAFMEALAFDTPELILLDIMLPGDDGLELLKKLKSSQKTKGIPVIMVTAKGTEYDKVIGLDSGADDYVTKPFGMMELVSRIKAVLRRSGKVVGEQSFNFYKRLAQGDVAYIVLGDVAPVNTVSPTPKLFHDGQIEAFKKLSDALHEYDCKLGIQIFHPEYDVDALAELFRKGDMQAA